MKKKGDWWHPRGKDADEPKRESPDDLARAYKQWLIKTGRDDQKVYPTMKAFVILREQEDKEK